MHLPQIATLFTTAIAIALATSACTPSEPATGMANPASVHCINAGGKLAIKHTQQGEIGICKLPSGKVCEEWALFRGECT